MPRRLTDEQREIRSGRGIPLKRWWPVAVLILAVAIAGSDNSALERCIGRPIQPSGARGSGLFYILLAYLCTPTYLRGSWADRAMIAAAWLPIPLILLNWFWIKRHNDYWDRIRERDKERRAAKRAARTVRD